MENNIKKSVLLGFAAAPIIAAFLSANGMAQILRPPDVIEQGNGFRDKLRGISFTPPEKWLMKRGVRSGEAATYIQFAVPNEPRMAFDVYYRMFSARLESSDHYRAWLEEEIVKKTKVRISKDGLADYSVRKGSIVHVNANGHAAVEWIADYMRSGEKWSEHYIRVVSANCTAYFCIDSLTGEVATFEPYLRKVVSTLKIP